jgi:ABC-type histidine transport system ATPase subunit
MSTIPRIRVAEVHERFGPLEVLRGVSFDVHRGHVVSVIGASGSGKNTLLRCVNYLERPNAGEFIWRASARLRLDTSRPSPARSSEINRLRRELGVVFQQYNCGRM